MDSTKLGASYSGPSPEPQRTMTLDQDTQTYQTNPGAEFQSGINPLSDLQSSPPPADPGLAAQLEEFKSNYGRAINALSERNGALDQMRQQMAEVQLELEALRAASTGRSNANDINLPEGVDPTAGATIQDLFQFGKNVANIVEQRLADATAQQIRASWGVTAQEEQVVLQRFPSYQNLPEPQRSQQIKRAVDLLIRPSQTVQAAQPAQSASSPMAPAPVTQRVVPHVERGNSPIDETVRGSAMQEALAVYNAVKTDPKLTPNQRASALRAAAEKIQNLTGTSMEDTMKTDWISRG
jgi:hypothetical protein